MFLLLPEIERPYFFRIRMNYSCFLFRCDVFKPIGKQGIAFQGGEKDEKTRKIRAILYKRHNGEAEE